jgi:hypothetical protein
MIRRSSGRSAEPAPQLDDAGEVIEAAEGVVISIDPVQ